MASKTVNALAAAALILSSAAAAAATAPPVAPASETVPAGQSELDGAAAGTWFGVLFTLATILVIAFHDELFDGDDDEEPVSA
ncbi:hypothetical protein [Sphingosinicella rhizophila]|uniref:Uncharacterized protein n=1 Tax=Sphingosinicella rhizophila TaxID=3050082 RepID=A0ABU3Q672_9SPHN|nr:hypothetical protein [Sphingosinicella sp. GR2756]MDT9598911.1 hypothetical protein [Sphingosinicella sp. GR2756]